MVAGACAGRADGQASVLGRVGRACWGSQGERAGARGSANGDTTMLACDTAMLACDTTEGPAATWPRLLRHGASARSARGHARPGRGLGAG